MAPTTLWITISNIPEIFQDVLKRCDTFLRAYEGVCFMENFSGTSHVAGAGKYCMNMRSSAVLLVIVLTMVCFLKRHLTRHHANATYGLLKSAFFTT